MKKNSIAREIVVCFSIIIVPIIFGTIIKVAFSIPTSATCSAVYGFLAFIFLPIDDISGRSDYMTNRINPSYRPEGKKFKLLSSLKEVIHLVVAIISLLVSLTLLTS